jgi:hypothetical protein
MSEQAKPKIGAALAPTLGLACLVGSLAWQWLPAVGPILPLIIAGGTPVGLLLGARFARRVGRWHPLALVAWMAVSAVLVGDAAVCLLAVVVGLATLSLPTILFAVVAYPFGLVIAGPFVLPLAALAATLWYLAFVGMERMLRGLEGAGHQFPAPTAA